MAPQMSSATPEQIDALLNFLEDHKDLARGRLRSVEGNVQAKRLWEELCNSLNAMGGCTKTIPQWQKVWFDRKHLAKKAAADARRSASATGGGPSQAPTLSQWQLKVLSIMGDGFGGRQTSAVVPAFYETNEPLPSISRRASQPQPLFDLSVEVEELSEPSPQASVSQDSFTFRSSLQSTQSRRRRSQTAAPSDLRSRLLKLEEERAERENYRNVQLTTLNTTLQQGLASINDTLKQLLNALDNRD